MKTKKKRLSQMTPDEIKAKIQSDMAAGRVEIASQKKVNRFPDLKKLFLGLVLQHPDALITDRSTVYHFNQWVPGIRITVMELFGVDIEPVLEKGGVLHEIFAYINRRPKSDKTLEQIAAQYGVR